MLVFARRELLEVPEINSENVKATSTEQRVIYEYSCCKVGVQYELYEYSTSVDSTSSTRGSVYSYDIHVLFHRYSMLAYRMWTFHPQ